MAGHARRSQREAAADGRATVIIMLAAAGDRSCWKPAANEKSAIAGRETMKEKARIQPLARDAMAYVLAGGRGSRLMELTDRRAKPAVYFGGKTRIIDFALSNALNSGIRRIGVATQYKAHSLIRHLQRGWNFLRPSATRASTSCPPRSASPRPQWYEGTADAVYQNIDIIESYGPRIHGHPGRRPHLQDGLRADAAQHVDAGADVTVGCLEVPRMEATGFGVMHVDEQGHASSLRRESPPIRRHSRQAGHGAGLDGHLCLRDQSS
jgi:ADP-glucose pyrophosphorylase